MLSFTIQQKYQYLRIAVIEVILQLWKQEEDNIVHNFNLTLVSHGRILAKLSLNETRDAKSRLLGFTTIGESI